MIVENIKLNTRNYVLVYHFLNTLESSKSTMKNNNNLSKLYIEDT